MLDTTAMHFDRGHALNGFGFVTAIWELSIGHDDDLTWWLQAVRDRWPDTQVIPEGEFGLNGESTRPVTTDSTTASMARHRRARLRKKSRNRVVHEPRVPSGAAARLDQNSPPMAIDFTRYDLKAAGASGLQREWSLMNVLNQKGTRPQDKPTCLQDLSPENRRLIFARYGNLSKIDAA